MPREPFLERRRKEHREALRRLVLCGLAWIEEHPGGEMPPWIRRPLSVDSGPVGSERLRRKRRSGDETLFLQPEDVERVDRLASAHEEDRNAIIATALRIGAGADVVLSWAMGRRPQLKEF